MTEPKCSRCRDCRFIANSDDGEPWSFWMALPYENAVAVRMGLVTAIPCPDCNPDLQYSYVRVP